MAAIGSAIGLGNLWAFPYKMGKGGGFSFLLIYLVFVAVIGFIIMLGELAIGRHGRGDPITSYEKVSRGWAFNGVIAVIVPILITSFYSVLGGWVIKYVITYVQELFGAGFRGLSGTDFFVSFVSGYEGLFWHVVFMAVTVFIVMMGVEKGIEKWSKVLMPALFVLLLIIIIRSVTLPGAGEGIAFMLKPDFTVFTDPKSFLSVAASAMAQMFWSLSLAMGIIITYGSYLPEESDIERNAVIIPFFDTLAAVMAGLAIMPAVFALGLDPASGPSLMFITLPEVFRQMPMGSLFGLMFYILVFFAALTSGISLLEVSTAAMVDRAHWSRKKAAVVMGVIIAVIGIPSALSQGAWSGVRPLLGMDLLDTIDYISEYTLMPICAFLSCIFISRVWGVDSVVDEVSCHGRLAFRSRKFYAFMVKYVTPLLIIILWYNSCIQPIINYVSA